MKYEWGQRSFRFYVSKRSSNRAERQGCCKSLEGKCWKLAAAGWETPNKPTTGQAPDWDARQRTKVDWQPAKMPTENCVRNKRHRKQPTTEGANWQTRTGDNVKLLLHNLFFISSFSDGCEKKYLERNKSRRVKKKKNYRLLPVIFSFSLCRTGYFLPTTKAIFAVLKKSNAKC